MLKDQSMEITVETSGEATKLRVKGTAGRLLGGPSGEGAAGRDSPGLAPTAA